MTDINDLTPEEIAVQIVDSHEFLWLFCGDEKWAQAHISAIRPAFDAYLKAKKGLKEDMDKYRVIENEYHNRYSVQNETGLEVARFSQFLSNAKQLAEDFCKDLNKEK